MHALQTRFCRMAFKRDGHRALILTALPLTRILRPLGNAVSCSLPEYDRDGNHESHR